MKDLFVEEKRFSLDVMDYLNELNMVSMNVICEAKRFENENEIGSSAKGLFEKEILSVAYQNISEVRYTTPDELWKIVHSLKHTTKRLKEFYQELENAGEILKQERFKGHEDVYRFAKKFYKKLNLICEELESLNKEVC